MAIIKVIVGIASGSMAVIASAVDSLLDMLMSLFNYYAVHNSQKGADGAYNYGRDKIEPLAALIEGILILLSGLFIIYHSAVGLITHELIEDVGIAIWVMLFSTLITAILAAFLWFVGKKSNSMIIKSDLLHYKSDLYVNVGIIASLGLITLTGWHTIDKIVSIAIALFIIYSAFNIAKEGVQMLLDHALEPRLVEAIIAILGSAPNVHSYHFLRTRRSAQTNVVEVHLVFNESIALKTAHNASDFVEEAIAKLDAKAKWLITVHLDPYDDSTE